MNLAEYFKLTVIYQHLSETYIWLFCTKRQFCFMWIVFWPKIRVYFTFILMFLCFVNQNW